MARRDARALVRRAHARRLCAGHFPGDPLLPGAYLAGLMADLAERLIAARGGRAAELSEVVRCVFLDRVRPDDEIVVAARLDATRGGRTSVETKVLIGERCAARATLRFGARR